MSATLLGVRHHGPGSARAVRAALAELRPDVVLIEGPPEADELVPLAGMAGMEPPVALLAYVAGEPSRSAFWPFAVFSPEWQAVRYALEAGVPVRFCDLPAAHTLAEQPAGAEPEPTAAEEVRIDPLGWLAAAAGYDDAERWWDDVVEHRRAGEPSPFAAIAEAMATLRAHAPSPPEREAAREARREAYMRRVLRRALADGHERVAVVCGAWHVPALAELPSAAADDRMLRGLPKVKVSVTWVPWTHGRLATWTGYGAGVTSPGWYHHLFVAPDRPVERWLAMAAEVLRAEDLPVSPAHVIEAVRLADALAALRGRPLAGLAEVTEATRAVLCEGAELPVELVQRRLVVGERLGSVPPATPMVPLQRHLREEQRRLRLPAAALDRTYDLDLRKPYDLDRSQLLHRLRLLGVDWGEPQPGRGRGTFHEVWSLTWRPELDVALIEASAWGTTVPAAAAARVRALAAGDGSLAELTVLAERCLLADLPDALGEVTTAIAGRAALDADVTHLMAALPALARATRYGDVRGTDVGALRVVVDEIVARVSAGFGPAVTALDDDAARELLGHVDRFDAAISLLADAALRGRWEGTLAAVAGRDDLHGLIDGRLTRLLLDAGRIGADHTGARMSRATSRGSPVPHAAAWIEGFLSSGGLLLVHDAGLLRLVDGWITGLPGDTFQDALPLLRRTFGGFAAPERRAIGEQVRRLDAPAADGGTAERDGDGIDRTRAEPAVHAVARILGLSEAGHRER